MKSAVSTAFLKVPLIVIGVVVLCLGASFVLTDPAPSYLAPAATALARGHFSDVVLPAQGCTDPPACHIPVMTVEAAGLKVRDEYFVVGVELNGKSLAYPLNMLSKPEHHVLDDTLGGLPIAVTWCGLCQSPVVYARQVEGKTLTLYVPGEIYGENMLMRDVRRAAIGPRCSARLSRDH